MTTPLNPSIVDFLRKNPKYGQVKYFVICDGKSGSSTLAQSFKHSLHAHSSPYLWKADKACFRTLKVSLRQMQDWSSEIYGKKPWVICAVREPIGRTISSFFQNLPNHVPPKDQQNEDAILAVLKRRFVNLENYHTFDGNVKEDHFDGIDLFTQEFNPEQGYAVYETDRLRIMVLKFEHIKSWATLIPSLLPEDERHEFHWATDNLSSDKPSYNLQKSITEKFRLPPHTLDQKFKLQENFLDHFYTKAELVALREKWTMPKKL